MSHSFNVTLVLALGVTSFLLHFIVPLFQGTNDEGTGCYDTYINISSLKAEELIEIIREKYIFPRPPSIKKENLQEFYPPWKELMQWDSIQETLLNFFQNEPPGIFVEVGAVDGMFLSQTYYLEKKLNWTGLLIEPDPRSFSRMMNSNRNATKASVCIKKAFPSPQKFWLRRLVKDLPQHFEQILLARSILSDEILEGDEARGSYAMVPCFPLKFVVIAANITTIDFLTIATGGDDDHKKIEDILQEGRFQPKTLLIHFPASIQTMEPIINLPGYIFDAKRSHVLYKFYVKQSHCKLQSSNDCVKVDHFIFSEACLKYICFGNVPVSSVNSINVG